MRRSLLSFTEDWFRNIEHQGHEPEKAIVERDGEDFEILFNQPTPELPIIESPQPAIPERSSPEADDNDIFPGEKAYELGFGSLGNGITVWNRLEERNNDYVTVAHISPERVIDIRDKEMPDEIQAEIEAFARTSTSTAFHIPPPSEPEPPTEPQPLQDQQYMDDPPWLRSVVIERSPDRDITVTAPQEQDKTETGEEIESFQSGYKPQHPYFTFDYALEKLKNNPAQLHMPDDILQAIKELQCDWRKEDIDQMLNEGCTDTELAAYFSDLTLGGRMSITLENGIEIMQHTEDDGQGFMFYDTTNYEPTDDGEFLDNPDNFTIYPYTWMQVASTVRSIAASENAMFLESQEREVQADQADQATPAEEPTTSMLEENQARSAAMPDAPDSLFPASGGDMDKEPQRVNYHISSADEIGAGGLKTKYRQNIDAIRLLKELEENGRLATQQEQGILAKYVGWGGMPGVFDPEHKNWQQEYRELKELLTEKEYTQARSTVLNAHYTSMQVIDTVYAGLRRIGYEGGGNVLEPSMGIGNFFGCISL